MTKSWGAKFDTLGGMGISAFSAERREQFAISSAHQIISACDETDRSSAQIMRLPRAFRDAGRPKQDACNVAIGRAVFARVERAQGLRQALTPLQREAIWIVACAAASERAP